MGKRLSAPEMAVDGEPLFPEPTFRWVFRLFGIGMGIVEANFGDPPLLRALAGGYLLFGSASSKSGLFSRR
jgi:hypothetical protein